MPASAPSRSPATAPRCRSRSSTARTASAPARSRFSLRLRHYGIPIDPRSRSRASRCSIVASSSRSPTSRRRRPRPHLVRRGKMARKQTTFDDFIACAETLLAARPDDAGDPRDRGRQRRGPLMGAVVNLRRSFSARWWCRRRSSTSSRRCSTRRCRSPSASSSSGATRNRGARVRLDHAYRPLRQPQAGRDPAMLVHRAQRHAGRATGSGEVRRPAAHAEEPTTGRFCSGSTSRSATAARRAASTRLREIAEDDVFLLVELGLAR